MSVEASSWVRRLHGSMLPGVGCGSALASALADGPVDDAVLGGGTTAVDGGGATTIGDDGDTEPEAPAPPDVQAPSNRARLRIAA
jgi:hypothetical protein